VSALVLTAAQTAIARRLSETQRLVLWMAPCYVHRGEVRTARSLVRLGLGILEDNGALRCDDARWHFAPNDVGVAVRDFCNVHPLSPYKASTTGEHA